MSDDLTPYDDVERIRAEREQWRSLADMLAYTLHERAGVNHNNCDPSVCAIRYVLNLHAEASR